MIVGSMNPTTRHHRTTLPKEVHELVAWLKNDELRNIKAEPTLAYFENMQVILNKMAKELRPGSKIAMVISKASQFYRYKTRETLFTVDVSGIFTKMFIEAGFKEDKVIDIELAKTNPVARPRALDKYYETILIFSR